MSQYNRFVTSILLVLAMTSMGRISAASAPITGSLTVQLNYVASAMTDNVEVLYESTMAEFYQSNFNDLSNVTVKVMFQELKSTPATRLRRLQTNTPLNTLLMVSGIVSDTSNMTGSDLSSQLIDITADQSATVVYLLKAADPSYFGTLASVVGSSLTDPVETSESNATAPEDNTTDPATPEANATAPVPAPAKAPAPVMVPGPFGFNNPMGVKVSISISALWFIAVSLGVGILFLYPEEKVPDNWKAVSSS